VFARAVEDEGLERRSRSARIDVELPGCLGREANCCKRSIYLSANHRECDAGGDLDPSGQRKLGWPWKDQRFVIVTLYCER
jgi:hypothetical protein